VTGQPEVVVYSTPWCGYCAAAKSLLHDMGVTYREIDVSGDAVQRDEMVRRSGQRTVPQIFIGERHVGGFDELARLHRECKLHTMLASSD
jgi:glutaredoxin 3